MLVREIGQYKESADTYAGLSAMEERSVIETGVSVTSSGKVLTLSTCTNGGADRFIIMPVVIADFVNDLGGQCGAGAFGSTGK